jgi:hypothetical protein
MILDELYLEHFANEVYSNTGLDTNTECVDRAHFLNYKKLVIYQHNARGFRDDEWPDDLAQIFNNMWCVGDSFTMGMGQPQEEIWPYLLKELVPELVFNVSLNGASNDWISKKINYISAVAQPKTIFVQWTYLHRREHPNPNLCDEDRRLHYIPSDMADPDKDVRDFENFIKNIESISHNTPIVHSFIPDFTLGNKDLEQKIYAELEKRKLIYFPSIEPLDKSRDGHHYDVMTAAKYAETYLSKLL